jgi:hypothetical protein
MARHISALIKHGVQTPAPWYGIRIQRLPFVSCNPTGDVSCQDPARRRQLLDDSDLLESRNPVRPDCKAITRRISARHVHAHAV